MAISTDSIIDPTSTVPANSEEASKESDTSGIPEEVLALPITRALLEGSPPALWAPQGTKGPEVAIFLKHGKELNQAGIGFYRSSDKEKLDLVYNSRFISSELLKKADDKGKLKEVASPLLEVLTQINGAVGEPAPVMASAGGMPSPVPVDSPLNTNRIQNLAPGSPTSGNFPGAGRILNEITKNTI